MSDSQRNVGRQLDDVCREIHALQRDLYGDTKIRQQGVFDRLTLLEEHLTELRVTYERERIEQGTFERLEADVEQMKLDYRVMLIYLKGIAGAVGAVFIAVMSAIVVGLLRYWST